MERIGGRRLEAERLDFGCGSVLSKMDFIDTISKTEIHLSGKSCRITFSYQLMTTNITNVYSS